MKTRSSRQWWRGPRTLRGAGGMFTLAVLAVSQANAQLAITEVMSAPWSNPLTGFRGPEFWELTNFGTNEVNLDGYSFRDSVATRPLVREPFTNLVVRPGESIVFFRVADSKASVTNVAQFRSWWGEGRLPPELQCRIWKSPGLSGWDGDAIWLFDPARTVVDVVQFGRARLGRAFTYEPDSGTFGLFSADGVNGAFGAVLADDVGSPGSTSGAVPVRFLQEPVSHSVDAGMTATFTTAAAGLPPPQYQWFFGNWAIPGAFGPTLSVSNVQPADAGAYQVWISNGLSTAVSRAAMLHVNTNDTPPAIVIPPADATAFDRQTAFFGVAVRGLPAPRFQWASNGVEIAGATNSQMGVPNVVLAWSGTRYSVRVWNPLGETNVSALLIVTRRPDLRFTEIMALPTDEEGNRHFDWFELTNYDTNAVNLAGWRFSDQPSFTRAYTITNELTLEPGESAVFAERLDEPLFTDWWGRDNLPANFKLCTYTGFGLGYFGEQLLLWNPAATDPNDTFASVLWAAATLGVSFECQRWCDPTGEWCEDEATVESVAGTRGAFRAANGMDVGSPGYIANPPLRILSAVRSVASPLQVTLTCRVIPNRNYRLWRATSPASSSWDLVEAKVAFSNTLILTDAISEESAGCFYRVEEAP